MADAKGQTMLAIERKNEILQKLRAEQRVLVSELAAHYQVTEETIRRDLDKLEKEGYATKTYGGAILGNSTKTDLSHAIRSKTNVEFKNQIADLVCQMVDDGDHLMIDDSSTALFCAKKLRDKKNLTIITNSVELVVELANVETWSILLTGGRLKAESLALVGSQCEKYLGNYHVDKVFVSCKGLDREAGVTDSNELNAQAKRNAPRWAAEDSRRRQLEDRQSLVREHHPGFRHRGSRHQRPPQRGLAALPGRSGRALQLSEGLNRTS